MENKKYSFFDGYHKALSRVSDERYGRIVRAMSSFAFYGEEPKFNEDADWVVWELIRPVLEKGLEMSQKRADAGKSGGMSGKGISRNKGNGHASKSKANQKQIKSEIEIGIGIEKEIGIGIEDSKKVAASAATLPKRKEEFYNSLVPYFEQYGKETVLSFFTYWTEPNRSHTKMRYELEKTWDVSLRLATWAKRETQFNTGNPTERTINAAEEAIKELLAANEFAKDDDGLSNTTSL